MQCYATQYCNAFNNFGCVDLKKLYEIKRKASQTDDRAKSYDISKFPNFYAHLCLSNHLGRSFSLFLLVDLAKMYENKWSQCSNNQIIKNLWLLEVRNLLMQCYATQYYKPFGSLGCINLEKLYEIKKNASQTNDRAKSYDILKFPNFYVHFMLV